MSEALESGYRRDRLSVADQVLKDLREQILSGRLERGAQLPSEKELARRYEVSAPTIREAVRALSAMSLVEARHGAGTFVTAQSGGLMASALAAVVELEQIGLVSILELSEAFYLKAANLAVQQADDDELAELLALAGRYTPAMTAPEFATGLREFLIALVAASHNGLLITIAGYLIECHITLIREVSDKTPSRWKRIAEPLVQERVTIAKALRARDDAAAGTAIHQFIARAQALARKHAG